LSPLDSIVERLPGHKDFQLQPPTGMPGESNCEDMGGWLRRLDSVFNVGVGGDRYQDIMYRLIGDLSSDTPLVG
jgi:hypothetical protein